MQKKKKIGLIVLFIIVGGGISLYLYYDYRTTHYDIPEDYPRITGTGLTYYVDGDLGNDENSGISPDLAWKTVEKVNTFTFSEGDKILFKRNCTWRERIMPQGGTKEGWLYYGAYGEGEKPLFLGSVSLNNTAEWTDLGDNLWQWDSPLAEDAGNLIFNNENKVGVKKWEMDTLNSQGDFYFNKSNSFLYLKSAENPANFYDNIECALGQHMLYLPDDEFPHMGVHDIANVVFENLAFRYGGAYAFKFQTVHHIQILNCKMAWMGGAEVDGQPNTRYGNGIEFFGLAFHCVASGNVMSQIYDSGISFQSINSPAAAVNLVFTNNTISTCGYTGYELWLHSSKGEITDVDFSNNTLEDMGYGWGGQEEQRKQGAYWGFGYLLDVTPSPTNNINMTYNIISNCSMAIFALSTTFNGFEDCIIDYNTYYGSASDILFIEFSVENGEPVLVSEFQFQEFSDYIDLIGKEEHTIIK